MLFDAVVVVGVGPIENCLVSDVDCGGANDLDFLVGKEISIGKK